MAEAVAPREQRTAPWYLAQLIGRDDRAVLESLGFQIFSPAVLRLVRLPKNKLSQAQRRRSAAVVKPQPAPLLEGYVFMKGSWWETADSNFRGGFLADDNGFPIEIADDVVARIQAYGTVLPGTLPLRRMLGIAASLGGAIDAALAQKIADVDEATIVKIIVALAASHQPDTRAS
jgi:hypothetical protein